MTLQSIENLYETVRVVFYFYFFRYPRKINEWMWDYANSLGYLTSYGVDTGNGLFGTRTVCKVNHSIYSNILFHTF